MQIAVTPWQVQRLHSANVDVHSWTEIPRLPRTRGPKLAACTHASKINELMRMLTMEWSGKASVLGQGVRARPGQGLVGYRSTGVGNTFPARRHEHVQPELVRYRQLDMDRCTQSSENGKEGRFIDDSTSALLPVILNKRPIHPAPLLE